MNLVSRLTAGVLLLAGSVLFAQPAPAPAADANAHREIGYAFMHTAKLTPATFKKMETGPFKLPFIGEPKPVENKALRAEIPPELVAQQKEGFVRAALKVGADGKVTQIGIIDASPKGVVEQPAARYLQQVAFEPQKRKGQAIEFETDVFLAYKFVAQNQKGPPGKKR